MFDELYPQASEVALEAKLNRPPETQTPRFSTWGMLSAAPKGLAAGAAQAIGSTADMLGAYGSVMGTTGGSAGGMFATQTPEERKQQNEATDKLLAGGPDYMSEGGRLFRNVAKDYTPDPVTTHAAEGAVFNLFRMGSKAITAAVTMGNIPGAIVAGAEEGFTMSDELAQQGVDIGTRTQVGAVNAVMNAGAFALPAAGKTWMQTAALALVGGPVSFVSQQAATREILQAADYTKQAEQYDPFDPLGLALSTILPLGFGALVMRGRKGAGFHPPEDIVDAARVSLVRQHMDSTNPVPGDLAAADAHVKAYSQAMEQLAAGERVSVDDVAPKAVRATDTPQFKAWFGESKVVDADGAPMVVYHGTSSPGFDSFDLGKRGTNTPNAIEDVALHFSDNPRLASRYADMGGPNGAVMPVYVAMKNPMFIAENVINRTDIEAAKAAGHDGIISKTDHGTEYVAFNPTQIKSATGNSGRFDPNSASLTDPIAVWGAGLKKALDDVAAANQPKVAEAAPAVDVAKATTESAPAKAAAVDLPAAKAADGRLPQGDGQATAADPDTQASPTETRLAAIEARNPAALDAEIATDFDDAGRPTERMTVREYLDQVKRDALADTQDAGLLEVAANCFLNGGL